MKSDYSIRHRYRNFLSAGLFCCYFDRKSRKKKFWRKDYNLLRVIKLFSVIKNMDNLQKFFQYFLNFFQFLYFSKWTLHITIRIESIQNYLFILVWVSQIYSEASKVDLFRGLYGRKLIFDVYKKKILLGRTRFKPQHQRKSRHSSHLTT